MRLYPSYSTRLRLLRYLLLLCACGWGISVVGLFMPWSYTAAVLNSLGMESVPESPMFIYWFRMTASAFTLIGIMFFLLAMRPEKYRMLVSIAGLSMLLEGLVLLLNGLSLGLAFFPFAADLCFTLGGGSLIVLLNASLKQEE